MEEAVLNHHHHTIKLSSFYSQDGKYPSTSEKHGEGGKLAAEQPAIAIIIRCISSCQ